MNRFSVKESANLLAGYPVRVFFPWNSIFSYLKFFVLNSTPLKLCSFVLQFSSKKVISIKKCPKWPPEREKERPLYHVSYQMAHSIQNCHHLVSKLDIILILSKDFLLLFSSQNVQQFCDSKIEEYTFYKNECFFQDEYSSFFVKLDILLKYMLF